MSKLIFIFSLFFAFSSLAQEDTLRPLNEVKVNAFASNRSIYEVAAPVHILDQKELDRFENTGFLRTINQYPGIRMEERSPGSYRLSIRGSSVRSPFGVRNVKVYWNQIPLTDANGDTYFNQMDMNSFQGIEILKGPSGSLYGAGIGGVILLDSKAGKVQTDKHNKLKANASFGSFNSSNRSITLSSAGKKANSMLNYSHAGTAGYRDHSKMARDVFNWRSSFYLTKKYTLNLFSFYGDLFYQTPGGLTFEQMKAKPRAARPGNAFAPGSVDQKAAIYQKLFSFGISQEYIFNPKVSSKLAFFGSKTELKNPFITNFEVRNQNSIGVRNSNIWQIAKPLMLTAGFEMIKTNSTFDVYDNEGGKKGDVQFNETVNALQSTIFLQLEAELTRKLFITSGISFNKQVYDYNRKAGAKVNNDPNIPLIPRLAILKQFKPLLSIFGSISGGYSPPTVQEFITPFENPQDHVPILGAESGTNYEIGLKGKKGQFQYEINGYHLNVNNAIIRTVNSNGRDVFKNAGKTQQKGLEFLTKFNQQITKTLFSEFLFSADLKDFRYQKYSDAEKIFDGNKIPSVPNKAFAASVDFSHTSGLFFRNNFNYVDQIPLNDANTVSADSYFLYHTRIGWNKDFDPFAITLHLGVNNVFNSSYSLGNDINAFGNRYFNPSPSRNWNSGISLHYLF